VKKTSAPKEMNSETQKQTILLINGPNLNMLGKRDPAQYGNFTLQDVENAFIVKAEELGFNARFFQSNIEGEIVTAIHEAMDYAAGIVINAGAYTHYSYALLDAIQLAKIPVMEVHISDISKREPFRRISVIQEACVGQISGLGLNSYLVGLEQLVNIHILKNEESAASSRPLKVASGMESLRNKINEIDTLLINLFHQRMAVSEKVAAEKSSSGAPVYDADREDRVYQAARDMAPAEMKDAAASLMRTVLRLSRARQYEILLPQLRNQTATAILPQEADGSLDFVKKVSFGGTAGSYSEMAAKHLFPEAECTPAWSFSDACIKVMEGEADVAVLPLANTSGGDVDAVYRLLQQHLFIARSTEIRVEHVLAVLPGTELDDIKTVVSHPQALAQCSQIITDRHWTAEQAENTAYAPADVLKRNDKSVAAICSSEAADAHGLETLPLQVSDTNCNKTRFIAVVKKLIVTPDASRLSIIMHLPHRIGALASALEVFSDKGLNLSAISSQPVPDRPWEYAFFIDISARALDTAALSVICQLSYELPRMQILGWYGETPEPK
jgi:chorismate mutase/prephenate dehydratase